MPRLVEDISSLFIEQEIYEIVNSVDYVSYFNSNIIFKKKLFKKAIKCYYITLNVDESKYIMNKLCGLNDVVSLIECCLNSNNINYEINLNDNIYSNNK